MNYQIVRTILKSAKRKTDLRLSSTYKSLDNFLYYKTIKAELKSIKADLKSAKQDGKLYASLVCEYLEEILIDDPENWKKISPFSKTKIKDPIKEIKVILKKIGLKLSGDVAHNSIEYSFTLHGIPAGAIISVNYYYCDVYIDYPE